MEGLGEFPKDTSAWYLLTRALLNGITKNKIRNYMGTIKEKKELDLTVVLPCRDERNTVGICVDTARGFMEKQGLRGEVLVVDNGSRDGSAKVAKEHGARVIRIVKPGYGRALRLGFHAAKGSVIVAADCDNTYDLRDLGKLYWPIANGTCDLVIGDRFWGGIEKGAMPFGHKWGVKWLSALGRWRFRTDVRDFHCGFRGGTRGVLTHMKFRTTGMEFATEMIAVAAGEGMRILQVPVKLRKCKVPRKSKLRTIRDGMRHLRYIIIKGV